MKKLTILASVALAMFLQSCGGSKQASKQTMENYSYQKVQVAVDPCQEYADLDPLRRAAGSGIHLRETTATNTAQLAARANLAKMMQQLIDDQIKTYAKGEELFASDGKTPGATVADEKAGLDESIAGWSTEIVRYATIVKRSRYKTQDNRWEIHVCLELNQSPEEIAKEVTEKFAEKLTSDQKKSIGFDEEKFLKDMKKRFNK